jgi:putative pyruvate formate lyase activating enzyme
MNIMTNCTLCPRKCGVNRSIKSGYCGAKDKIILAKSMLHKWEEPCISVKNGAGTVFFSGCSLHCCYCQNSIISSKLHGKEVSAAELADVFLTLQKNGADNIELVTPTHFVPQIIDALNIAKPSLNIPVVYNTGGYELPETIDMLRGYVDIFLPDLKYFSPEASMRYSNAPDYFKYASEAILKMTEQVGPIQYGENGAMLKGTIIRHLVLPGQRHDSMKLMDWISENIAPERALVSIMSQYTPFDFIPDKFSEIKRHITKMEYNSVLRYAENLGINGFSQEKSSASEEFVPDF